MNAFNNDQQLKNEVLANLKHHQELDAFVQGAWLIDEKVEGNGFKGCFYGCTMQTTRQPREAFSDKYSIDLWYCYLTEKIFEGLPKEEAKVFPLQSIELIPLGFDFNTIKSPWFKASLLKQKEWVTDENVLKILDDVATLFDTPFNEINEGSAGSAARSAESAGSAAWSAAWSAESAESAESAAKSAWSAGSAAWSAGSAARSAESAGSAAESAARSAESAAWSAGSAARSAESAESAAKENHYIWMRDTLFSFIKEATK